MTKGQGFGFGLGKMKELADAFKKAQQVQENAKTLQIELEQKKEGEKIQSAQALRMMQLEHE